MERGHLGPYPVRCPQHLAGELPPYSDHRDLGELRATLGQEPAHQASTPPFDVRAPNIARVYNYWLGGKDHCAADRKAGGSVLDDFPEVALVAHANREFVTRAVRDGQPWAASRQSLRMRRARCSYVGNRKSRKTDTLSVRCWAACR